MAGASGVAGKGGIGGSTAGSGGAGGRGGAVGAGGVSGGGTSGAAGMSGNEYMPCPTTAGTACAILPLGDSITEGWLPTGGVGGYRVELFSKAVLAGKNITFVGSQTSSNAPNTVENQTFPKKHEGHDGYTIDTGSGNSGISGSITDQAMANYHPNIVLLMIGTNDVNGNIDVANAPTRLGKLIDEITDRFTDGAGRRRVDHSDQRHQQQERDDLQRGHPRAGQRPRRRREARHLRR